MVGALAQRLRGEALISVDNEFTLFVNGQAAARGDQWNAPARIDISPLLIPGTNVIAVQAVNTEAGPAGVLAAMHVHAHRAPPVVLATGTGWVCAGDPPTGWEKPAFDDSAWTAARSLGPLGIAPWGDKLPVPATAESAPVVLPPLESYEHPMHDRPVVFVLGLASFRGGNFIQNIRGTRAYFEFDTPSPAALGRRLMRLSRFRPDGVAETLVDAGDGWIGSPSISADGAMVLFSMTSAGDPWFHIYSVPVAGGVPRRITDGPFHDFDPVELPDGRIAFASTRLGTAEEYHGVAAFSLFAVAPTGGPSRAITHHIVGDREPRVTADGMLAFIRCDNFLERAKVETHIHRTRLDGTGGFLAIGPDRPSIALDRATAAETGSQWLRRHGAGSPAPLSDGRVAAISEQGLVASGRQRGVPLGDYLPFDLSPLPDGRLLCADRDGRRLTVVDPGTGAAAVAVDFSEVRLPPEQDAPPPAGYRPLFAHSAVLAAPRPPVRAMPSQVDPTAGDNPRATGYLYCRNVFDTRHTDADMSRVRAVRIIEGRPFTLVPTDSIYIHIGTEGRELGVVPVAPDGSFHAEVPADRALTIQAVDAEGRPVISELSWIYVRPGERRSCIGCHAATDTAPDASARPAAAVPSVRLTGGSDPHRYRANNAANGGVLNLQPDRFREAAGMNQYRMPEGPDPLPPGREIDVGACIARTGSSDPDERVSAAQRLAVYRDPAAGPVLCGLLNDATDNVRLAAAVALAVCGGRDAVPALRAALEDANPVVAQAAHVALDHLTGGSPPYDPFAADRSAGLRAWHSRLDVLDWDILERDLAGRLAGRDRLKTHAAAETLGRIGGPAGADALKRFLESNPDAELRILLAALRSLGRIGGAEAVPLLAAWLRDHAPQVRERNAANREFGGAQRSVHLASAAAEALGWIGGEAAEAALIETFAELKPFENYTLSCGDHPWLMGCHSSPVHFRILEALDAIGSERAASLAAAIARSIPMDKDRALLYEPDSYEALSARVLLRSGAAAGVAEACLAVLGDPEAAGREDLIAAVGHSPHAEKHIRPHTPRARAAQILSIAAVDPGLALRIRKLAVAEWSADASEERSWVTFMLIRTLGRLRDQGATVFLRSLLDGGPTEASFGTNPQPNHWVFRAMRPYPRAAAAWALGRLADRESWPALLAAAGDPDNAPAVREAAAMAVGHAAPREAETQILALAARHEELSTRRALIESAESVSKRASAPE